MKNEEEIKRQLEEVYEHRLRLRVDRKTKRMCRNCKYGICKEFDLGDFGTMTKWECKDGKNCGEYCGFECRSTVKEIEDEMFSDIADPAVCGAKEPKIAMLLWVLHGKKDSSEEPPKQQPVEESSSSKISFWDRIKSIFD
jgi:hypothetical protein